MGGFASVADKSAKFRFVGFLDFLPNDAGGR